MRADELSPGDLGNEPLDPGDRVKPATAATGHQLIPPDITGKGSSGTGAAASVLEHRFGKSDPYTLGVEEEYQLLDGT